MKVIIGMPKMGNSLMRIYMKSKYVFSLHRAGAKVRWIPWEDTPKNRARLLSCDGLLMPGGVDIEPARYGQETDPQCGKIDLARDAAEWWMLESYLPTRKPVLCICRGIQMLNVFCGGTLHQHIPGHSDFRNRGKGSHNVRVSPNTLLASITGMETLWVNSMHHQAVDKPASNVTVSAVNEDGITEAVELTDHPFCIGVQWHPEHLSKTREDQQKLFDAFVEACKK